MEQSRNDQDAHYSYDEQRYCTAIRSIDTVRALHQTVVSLRSALDESRQEIEKLKKQIVVNNEIQEARHLHHITENPSDNRSLGEKVSELEKFYKENKTPQEHQQTQSTTEESRTTATHSKVTKIESSFKNEQGQTISVVPDIKISTHPSTSGTSSTINNMASRIDVKIKVSSNINVDSSTDDSDSQKPTDTQNDPNQEDNKSETTDGDGDEKNKAKNPEIEVYEDSNTNTFNVDAKNLKIRVTSEENLNVTKSVERICIQQSSSEYLNLDIDELSEGDNSVFTEGATTPIMERMQQVEDIETDGEGGEIQYDEGDQKEEQEKDDIPDEVDDIELIFSSDDNKDVMQEDLVSISEYEPWQTPGASGTPVLTKFGTLSSEDRHREHYEEKKLAYKQAKLKQAKQQQQKEKNLSVDSQATIGDKSLESTDSLSFDNNNNKNSLDYKLSSLEKDSSIEQSTLSRDTSLDIPKPTSLGLNRKWTNVNVLIETDISKIGIGDNENILEMGRRNTCPNPPVYRPIIHSQTRTTRNPLAVKFTRSPRGFCPIFSSKSPKFTPTLDEIPATKSTEDAIKADGNKCSSSVQTDISALPHQWRSETQLVGHEYSGRLFTLPSKYSTPHHPFSIRSGRNALRLSDKTQEARRILLSDINFTSMVPELSRSADHLCQQRIREEDNNDEDEINESSNYFKGNLLKTPDYSTKGITPSFSMTSPGVSQWTVNESTTQTDDWNRGDSFDSTKSYSLQSGTSMNLLSKHHRSRSVPSMKCCICKQNHAHNSIRQSESLQYAQRHNNVTLRESSSARKAQGSLPDLRHQCSCSGHVCSGKTLIHCLHGCSSGSTESLLEETAEFLRKTVDDSNSNDNNSSGKRYNRRCSENDIQKDYRPSKQALPFLPRSPKCLKPGHLAKVIAKNGRVVVGRIRYVGPVASINANDDEIFIGLQLQNSCGDCDGTINGKKFFECEKNFGIFVPFKKVVMAWNS